MAARVTLAQPDAGDEVGRLRLESIEVTVQRQEHPHVFLRIAPAACGAVAQQPAHQLWNQVAVGLVDDERLQQDGVGTAAGMEQQVFAVAVAGGDCGRDGGLGHAVVEETPHLCDRLVGGRIVAEHEEKPANAFKRDIFQVRLGRSASLALDGSLSCEQFTHIEGVGGKPAADAGPVPGGKVVLDGAQVVKRAAYHFPGYGVALQPGAGQGMGGVDAVVGPDFAAAPPDGKAAAVVLQGLQRLQVAFPSLFRSRRAVGSPSASNAVNTSRSAATPRMREAICSEQS